MADYVSYVRAKIVWAMDPTEANNERLDLAFSRLVTARPPLCFRDGDPKNVLTELEKAHVKLSVTLSELGCPDTRRLTVYERYAWVETLEDKYEAQKAALTGSKHAKRQ